MSCRPVHGDLCIGYAGYAAKIWILDNACFDTILVQSYAYGEPNVVLFNFSRKCFGAFIHVRAAQGILAQVW